MTADFDSLSSIGARIPKMSIPTFDAAATQRSFQKAMEAKRDQELVDLGFAHVMYDRLMQQIQDFEKDLHPDEEVAAYLSSFGTLMLVQIESVGYHNPYFIVFHGRTVNDGQRVRLVQHTSQVSVLFVAAKVEDDRPARRVGFYADDAVEDEDTHEG